MEDEGSVTVTQKVEVGANREVQYTQLISELQAIGTERAFRIELEKVEAKYEMGEAISRSGLYEPYAYGAKLIPMIAKDLGMAERTLYWVLQFYAKVQEVGGLDTFLRDVPKHQIKWTHVRKMLVTPRDGESYRRAMCRLRLKMTRKGPSHLVPPQRPFLVTVARVSAESGPRPITTSLNGGYSPTGK